MSSDKAAVGFTDEDDDYHSSEDEDFNPDQQPVKDDDVSSSSDSGEEEIPKSARKSSKRKAKDTALNRDLDEDNSGDEVVIRSAKAKRKKTTGDHDGDEGGEGGLIKTRAQRAREVKERGPLSTTAAATVDVDALWRTLNSPSSPPKAQKPSLGAKSTIQTITTSRIEPVSPSTSIQRLSDGTPPLRAQLSTRVTSIVTSSTDLGTQVTTAEAITAVPLPASLDGLPVEGVETRAETTAVVPAEEDGMITIKRTYEFAGETVTEEKQVPANSFEARAYISSLQTSEVAQPSSTNPAKPLRRPMRKVSKFDPGVGGGAAKKATKLNSLEKSRLDWAGFVDKEGIGDELDKKRRQGGDSYLERQDFLGRVGSRTAEKR